MALQSVDPATLVDPELRPVLSFIQQLFPPPVDPAPQAVVRALRARPPLPPKPRLDAPPIEERTVPVPGAPDVRVFVINAEAGADRPAILHMHGGGFVLGDAASGLADLQVHARALDCTIVTVDYRLAPETPFPGALGDDLAALQWLHDEAEALGVDRTRIAVQGESAGGGHAAMLAIAARDRGGPAICLQALTYPMLDDRTGSSRPAPPHIGTFLWRPESNVAGWSALLGAPAGGETAPEEAVPARVEDLSGLPPVFISVGTLDLFVEEDLEYARRLVCAGVPTELLLVPGAFHGFDIAAPASSASRRHRLALHNALARTFGRPERNAPPEPAPGAFDLSPDNAA